MTKFNKQLESFVCMGHGDLCTIYVWKTCVNSLVDEKLHGALRERERELTRGKRLEDSRYPERQNGEKIEDPKHQRPNTPRTGCRVRKPIRS